MRTTHEATNLTRSLLTLGLLGLALCAGACGGVVSLEWDDDTDYTADEENRNYAADPAEREPDPAITLGAGDEELAGIEGWSEELAAWQLEHPGQDPWADEDDALADAVDDDAANADDATGGGEVVLRSCSEASGGKRGHLTMLQVGHLARRIGIPCGPRLVTAIAIAGAESANYRYRWHRNTGCTTDIGLWQINDYYHPEYAKTNVITNATGMKRISGKGRRWTAWYARNTETFRRYRRSYACDAGQRICGWKRTDNWRQRHCFCDLERCEP
jgi:hypothetical protein